LKLCRKGKCIFTVDYARAVYDETHSLERTEVVLSEMAAAAEARGAEVLGVNGWARVVGMLYFILSSESLPRARYLN
jgi:hypothetical protein